MEETRTINGLGLLSPLPRLFASTNIIASCFSPAGDLCRGVARWRGGNAAERRTGAVLLEAENHFRRLQGHGQLPLLLSALNRTLDQQETVAYIRLYIARPGVESPRRRGCFRLYCRGQRRKGRRARLRCKPRHVRALRGRNESEGRN
jgi:hypothetical protein